MKKIFLVGFLISSFSFFCQQKINNYKYVIVANNFDFLNKADQYKTSSLTKFLFNKYGFTSYLNTDELPEDFNTNRCSSLFASVKEASSMFTTKVNVVLKDCNGKIVYTSLIGKSKEKDYKKAFHEAIRGAFKDPAIRNHSYNPPKNTNKAIVKATEAQKTLSKVKKIAVIKTVNANTAISNKVTKTKKITASVLASKPTNNGFQLIDTRLNVVFKVLKTTQENFFIIENKNGILYKKNSNWIAEFYENNVLIQKEYQVKF
tara:strand:+ start:441 stop:1223 length:783 start_codon:yes stop_codon:yes gene_type:complete